MSHVDEGALHAYLDGALDTAYGTAEAARIREHVASCERCATRLEQEQALRSTAASVLSSADPSLDDLPSLEEMRAQAELRIAGVGRGRRLRRMAWAASIMVALGTGWMARQIMAPAPTAGMRDRVPAAAPSEADGQLRENERLQDDQRPREDERLQEDERLRKEADAGESDDTAAKPAMEESPVEAARERQAAPSPRLDENRIAQARRAGFSSVSERDAVPSLGDPEDPGVSVLATDVTPVTVPGLEILSVVLLTGNDFDGGVRVLQALEGGQLLEVLHLPPGVDPSLLTPLVEGYSEWVSSRADGWLVLRAPIDPDSLELLGQRIHGGG